MVSEEAAAAAPAVGAKRWSRRHWPATSMCHLPSISVTARSPWLSASRGDLASTPPRRAVLPLDPHSARDPLRAALGIHAVPHRARHGSALRRGSGPCRTSLDVDPRRARRGSSIWAMGALRLLGARRLGSLLSGCGGREIEEQDAGREEGDELLLGQCGPRAALTRQAEFAPSRYEGRRE